MWLVKYYLTVLLGTFFSFLMISQVDFINSNYAVSENLINPPVVSLEKKMFRAELSDNVSLSTWFEFNQPTCDIIRKEKKTFRAELSVNVSLTA